jgi:hypothetical protein
MLRGDDLKYLYRYLSEIIGRPVFTHEIPEVCEQFRDRIKADFIALCRNASDDIARDDESTTALAKMPELIDRHALLKNVFDNPPEKATMTHAEWCRKCIYEAPTIEAGSVRHGRWIPTKLKGYYECSACRYEHTSNPAQQFCSYCGARMDGATDVAGHCGAMMDGGTISRERFAEIMVEDERP